MPKTKPDRRASPKGGGHSTVYPGKLKDVLTFKMRQVGHDAMNKQTARLGISRSDYLEALNLKYGHHLTMENLPR